jgi:hypothetical protein
VTSQYSLIPFSGNEFNQTNVHISFIRNGLK